MLDENQYSSDIKPMKEDTNALDVRHTVLQTFIHLVFINLPVIGRMHFGMYMLQSCNIPIGKAWVSDIDIYNDF
jgi:hypothetical protein